MSPLVTQNDADALADKSILLVSELLKESNAKRSRRDEANRKRFARLLKDPAAIELTMALTDEVMRMNSMKSAAKTLRRSAKGATIPGLGIFDFAGIKLASIASYAFPASVMKIVHQRVRMAANGIILPAEQGLLNRHIRSRTGDEANLNINVLGEAVLGDQEAQQRLNSVIEMVKRPEVNYASVKISSIASQLITIDHAGSVTRVSERLRLLYRAAYAADTFINLDMEEFRDLEITVDVFKKLLDETEFENMNAGIVLQAYLPESHDAFADLISWAKARHLRTGGMIKIRLVKGANLAMEKAEAELHGWVPAPYESKSDVDASYARLIDVALRPENAVAVRIGIASHNLFHLSWAIEVARLRGVTSQLDIEMLEGMANAEALAISNRTGGVLLYTPVTKRDDFPAAVAYLVRRLDENTSTENYLRASFDMELGNEKYIEQRLRFLNSISERHYISTASRRHLLHRENPSESFMSEHFQNESDGDATHLEYRFKLAKAFADLYAINDLEIPLAINGKEWLSKDREIGRDPSSNGAQWYSYAVANADEVDEAVSAAQSSIQDWNGLGAKARADLLERAAQIMGDERELSIAIMARDSGKTVSEADPEISEGIDFARFYALSALSKEEGSNPAGVVLVVPPWNFPYAIPIGGICAALAAGNTVILKPAPETVATAWHFINQFWRAGIPKSVLHFLPTRDDKIGKQLVSHDGVDAVILTGAFDTASLFMSWKPGIRLLAETSGKNSILISASADIDGAVKDLVQSAFGHAGQKCSAASLAIVEESIYKNPAFLRQLKDAVESLSTGPGRDYSTTVGPIIAPARGALHRALTTLDIDESWLVVPHQLDTEGYLWSPGVKLGIVAGSWSHKNEWFGPVLGVMQAPDFETALTWQNQVDFGLTSGIQSLDVSECERWIDGIQAGNLYVNRGITGAIVNRQPFGGWKKSSVGPTAKAGGFNYINNLRDWKALVSASEVITSSQLWWDEIGSKSIDRAGLKVERNYQRYRPSSRGILIRFDADLRDEVIRYLKWVGEVTNSLIMWSTESADERVALAIIESAETLVHRVSGIDKVRWLSQEAAPAFELLGKGISLDSRNVASRGDVEMPRWLLEQSVSITNHRYGNIGAGPVPQLPQVP